MLSLEVIKGGITDGEVSFEGILVERGEVKSSRVWSLGNVCLKLVLLGLLRDRLGVNRDEGLLLEDPLNLIDWLLVLLHGGVV